MQRRALRIGQDDDVGHVVQRPDIGVGDAIGDEVDTGRLGRLGQDLLAEFLGPANLAGDHQLRISARLGEILHQAGDVLVTADLAEDQIGRLARHRVARGGGPGWVAGVAG